MARQISEFIKNCPKCILNKPKKLAKQPLKITSTPQKPFDSLIMDTIGSLQTFDSGNNYVVTLICNLTKYLICIPIPNKEASTSDRHSQIYEDRHGYGIPKRNHKRTMRIAKDRSTFLQKQKDFSEKDI